MPAPNAMIFKLLLAPILAGLIGCATGDRGHYWGADATLTPGWSRVGEAALKASLDPFTWAPAIGAAALQIEHLDSRAADWASDETPVFGSRNTASDASDWLRAGALTAYVGTGVALPAERENWLRQKAQGFAVGAAALGTTFGTTRLLKEVTDRDRPMGQGENSFPSSHASLTSASARLTHENLRYLDLAPASRAAIDSGLAAITLMTGWARVEAGAHRPAEVLAGSALGNFFAVFFTEAFLHPAFGESASLRTKIRRDGAQLQLSFAF